MGKLAALAGAVIAAQTLTPPTRIAPIEGPERTGPGLVSGAMSRADAQSFASALAQAGHPAGFIMPLGERQGLLPPDRGEKLTLDEALAAFTERGTYRVSKHGQTVVLQHAKTPADVIAALDVRVIRTAVKTTMSRALFEHVLRGLARVRVGGAIGPEPGAGPDCPIESTVSIPAGPASTMATLAHITSQVKGIAWQVRFGSPGQPNRLQVGYICGNGVWSALTVPGW